MPENADRLDILTEEQGKLYYKNTSNLFASVGNLLFGKSTFVEHKAYNPAEENFTGDLVGMSTWTIGGAAVMKGVKWRVLALKGNGRVFWSGGPEAMDAAMAFAKANGKTTLEMTRAGKNLTHLTKDMTWSESQPLWQRLSAAYAKGAKGRVDFFPGAEINPTSIWLNVEKPILLQNNIKIIVH